MLLRWSGCRGPGCCAPDTSNFTERYFHIVWIEGLINPPRFGRTGNTPCLMGSGRITFQITRDHEIFCSSLWKTVCHRARLPPPPIINVTPRSTAWATVAQYIIINKLIAPKIGTVLCVLIGLSKMLSKVIPVSFKKLTCWGIYNFLHML